MKDGRLKRCLQLFGVFFKIGAFTFGGGLAMIPLIQREVVENRHWAEEQDIMDIVAIAESTPGPIAINSATFIGYQVAGFWGSFFATLGTVLPSFIIISVISMVLSAFEQNTYVQFAFAGIRAGVLALLVKAVYTMAKKCPKEWWAYGLAALAFVLATFIPNFHILLVIGICAVLGLIVSAVKAGKERTK